MKPVIIIAEAGVNHNGSLETAYRLIEAAAAAGVDYVKFQTFRASRIAAASAKKADYQQQNTGSDGGQLDMLKKLELSEADHHLLIAHCAKNKIKFLSTPFDEESIVLLKGLGITTGKIPSGEITNLPYLRAMATAFDELILSTGMADMEEIKAAVQVFISAGKSLDQVTILHCNTEYPTPFADVNLKAMNTIAAECKTAVGYSDHTTGIEVPIAAVALGATLIEKHFTLDRDMEGPDHKASLEPGELTAMVSAIRNIELAISGDGQKKASPSEIKNKPIARKSIVAAMDIKAGEIFTAENLTTKRPGNGVSPMQWDEVIGTKAVRDFSADELIEL